MRLKLAIACVALFVACAPLQAAEEANRFVDVRRVSKALRKLQDMEENQLIQHGEGLVVWLSVDIAMFSLNMITKNASLLERLFDDLRTPAEKRLALAFVHASLELLSGEMGNQQVILKYLAYTVPSEQLKECIRDLVDIYAELITLLGDTHERLNKYAPSDVP